MLNQPIYQFMTDNYKLCVVPSFTRTGCEYARSQDNVLADRKDQSDTVWYAVSR